MWDKEVTFLDRIKFYNLIEFNYWSYFLSTVGSLNVYPRFEEVCRSTRKRSKKQIYVRKRMVYEEWYSRYICCHRSKSNFRAKVSSVSKQEHF